MGARPILGSVVKIEPGGGASLLPRAADLSKAKSNPCCMYPSSPHSLLPLRGTSGKEGGVYIP
jgi:hypothetical protein